MGIPDRVKPVVLNGSGLAVPRQVDMVMPVVGATPVHQIHDGSKPPRTVDCDFGRFGLSGERPTVVDNGQLVLDLAGMQPPVHVANNPEK